MSELQVMQMYNFVLKKVEADIGSDTTYTTALEAAGLKYLGSRFAGVYPSDRIPKLTEDKPYAIINVDSSEAPGSHWVGIAKADEEGKTIVYDSFARKTSKLIPSVKASQKGSSIIETDRDVEQAESELNCGARSIAFLISHFMFGDSSALKI